MKLNNSTLSTNSDVQDVKKRNHVAVVARFHTGAGSHGPRKYKRSTVAVRKDISARRCDD